MKLLIEELETFSLYQVKFKIEVVGMDITDLSKLGWTY